MFVKKTHTDIFVPTGQLQFYLSIPNIKKVNITLSDWFER